jgi:acyl carrier protein
MEKLEIIQELKSILRESLKGKIDIDKIDENTDLIKEVKLDSIEALNILLLAEERFNIEIDDEDLNKETFQSLSFFADFISNIMKKN